MMSFRNFTLYLLCMSRLYASANTNELTLPLPEVTETLFAQESFYEKLYDGLKKSPLPSSETISTEIAQNKILKYIPTPQPIKIEPSHFYLNETGNLFKAIPFKKPLTLEKSGESEFTLQLHGQNKIVVSYDYEEEEKDLQKRSQKKQYLPNDPNKPHNVRVEATFNWSN